MKTRIIILCIILILVTGCQQPILPPTAIPTATITPPPILNQEKRAEHLEIFEIVWQTVNEMYFDPTFGGVDWEAIHDEYLPLVENISDEKSFYLLINEMCFELGVSHIGLLPPGMSDQLDPVVAAPGSVGLDVRLLAGRMVITDVGPGSPADRASLRPGFILLSVTGIPVENKDELITLWMPPRNDRKENSLWISAIQGRLHGQPGQQVPITYLDDQDQLLETTLVMEQRTEKPFIGEDLPPMYVNFEAKRLEGGIAYIRFDGFLPPVLEGVLTAIKEMHDAPGMIIDIRGNPGGIFPVRKAIASQFFQDRTLLWHFVIRPGLNLPGFETVAYSDPPEEAYLGPVVILVDVMSGSSSEEFSGAMSASQRATIIGNRTSGSDLVADIRVLSNGALFIYPLAQTQTADGTVLENRGVIPDIEIDLTRSALLEGRDSQLEAAIQFLTD